MIITKILDLQKETRQERSIKAWFNISSEKSEWEDIFYNKNDIKFYDRSTLDSEHIKIHIY